MTLGRGRDGVHKGRNICRCDRSGQVWEHAPEQRIAASTFRRYSRGLRPAIPQADARPIPISLRCRSTCCNHEARGQPIGLSTHETPSLRESGEQDQRQENEPHVHTAGDDTHGLCRKQISFESLSATTRWTQSPTSKSHGFSEETLYQRN